MTNCEDMCEQRNGMSPPLYGRNLVLPHSHKRIGHEDRHPKRYGQKEGGRGAEQVWSSPVCNRIGRARGARKRATTSATYSRCLSIAGDNLPCCRNTALGWAIQWLWYPLTRYRIGTKGCTRGLPFAACWGGFWEDSTTKGGGARC